MRGLNSLAPEGRPEDVVGWSTRTLTVARGMQLG